MLGCSHCCSPLRFSEHRTGSCEHSLMFRPSLSLISAMIQHSPKASGPRHSYCVTCRKHSFYPTCGLLGASPQSHPRALAAKGLLQTVRIGNQRNEPSTTPAPHANYRACKTSTQTTASVNNFRENTLRERSICQRNK